MRFLPLLLAPASVLLASLVTPLAAQDMVTEPLGFNTVTCLPNSDTIVGVPFRQSGSQQGVVSAVDGAAGTVTVANDPGFTAGAFANSYYLKFKSGAKDGHFYTINGNTADTLTLSMNGNNLDGVAPGDGVLIAKYWTLNELFPPAGATTTWTETPAGSGNWVPNGHAIVASTSTLSSGRRTELLVPDIVSSGTNLPPSARYYIHSGLWKLSGGGNTDRGSEKLHPDNYFTIRHPVAVSKGTSFKSSGEVETGRFSIPLSTVTSGQQDNFVAVPRPLNATLEQLNLRQSGAFVASTSTLSSGRRDQLLVFDNAVAAINKPPSATYYVHNGIWKLSGGGNTDRGTVVIPAGAGLLVRKYQTTDGSTAFWAHLPNY